MLDQVIEKNEKTFNPDSLHEIIKMEKVIRNHFEHPVNITELRKNPETMKCYDNFRIMLNECESILNNVETVEKNRIIKRFKILRSMLYKLMNKMSPPLSEKSILIDNELQSTERSNTQFTKKSQRLTRTRSDDSFDIVLRKGGFIHSYSQEKRKKGDESSESIGRRDIHRILYRPCTSMLKYFQFE